MGSTPTDQRTSLASEMHEQQGLSLLDVLVSMAKRWKLVVFMPVLAATIALAASFLLPNAYVGTARILPPQQPSGVASLIGQLGVLGGLGASGALGMKNPADLYVGMLQSRTVADAIISRFSLQQLYAEETLVQTRRALQKVTDITAGKDGIISISVEDADAKRAADLANAYVEELDKLTQTIAVTEAAQRRLFFERQLHGAKDSLADAEVQLRQTQEKSGLIHLEEQARAIISTIATLQAQLKMKEVEVASMRTYTTPQNPEYLRAQEQLGSMRKHLVELQRKHSMSADPNVIVPTGNIPQVGLDYVRKFRDVKYQEALFEVLAKQFEQAKIDEARDAALIQVIDRAIPADRKAKPRRALIAATGFMIALFLASLIALSSDMYQRGVSDPRIASKLAAIRGYLLERGR